MYVMNITNGYDSFTSCTNNENDDINIIIKNLLLSIPSSIIFLSLLGLIIWSIIKPLIIGLVFIPDSSSSLCYLWPQQRRKSLFSKKFKFKFY